MASSIATRAPAGAATEIVHPPRGPAMGALSTASDGMESPLHVIDDPARPSARSQSRSRPVGATSNAMWAAGGAEAVHSAREVASPWLDPVIGSRSSAVRDALHAANASTTSTRARIARSIATRRVLARERIDHHIHGELRVVHREEALVVRMVTPLRGVVLVAIEHGEPIVAHHALQVLVHEVVSP